MKRFFWINILVCVLALLSLRGISAEPTSSNDSAIKRKFRVLGIIWQDLQGQEMGTDSWKELLDEFLSKSQEYVSIMPEGDKNAAQVWTFRTLAACELDRMADAEAAGKHMQELGLDKSSYTHAEWYSLPI